MENLDLRKQFQTALESVQNRLEANKRVILAMVLGSMSHDKIWEWSDLQVLCIVDDSYKGPENYNLIECGVQVLINMRRKNAFLEYLQNTDASDYYYCAVSKGTLLFTKDKMIVETIQDFFYIGSREREVEMLLGFSTVIYCLNKTEKNLHIKNNLENSIFFVWQIAPAIAWIEVAKNSQIPEREIIAQARKFTPDIFKEVYDPLIYSSITKGIVEGVINACHRYLEQNTEEVYRPILSHLRTHGTLAEFSFKTHKHGFGINYDWLLRMGIAEVYPEPIKLDGQPDLYYKRQYKLKRDEKV